MIFVGDRIEMERLYDAWAREHHVARYPQSVIAFLQINKLINEDAFREYLKKYGYRRGGELLEKGDYSE